jgi:hypothetical protein
MSRYFAEIGPDNIVLRVVVCSDPVWLERELGGVWVETFIGDGVVRYCGKGHGYDEHWPTRFAPLWQPPETDEDAYPKDQLSFYNGRIWINDAESNKLPPAVANGWRDSFIANISRWSAGVTYRRNDRVIYKAKLWQSTRNNNTSEPGVADWTEVFG